MRPDRFGQSAGKDFVESKGRERDGGFPGDAPPFSQIFAFANLFGFPAYNEFNEQLLPDIEIYPRLRVRETYFDASTHEVLLSFSGDVSSSGSYFGDLTYQEIAGSYTPIPVGVPIVAIAQTRTTQTLQMGGFCTSVNTLEGTPIPIQDFLHTLYELHALKSDFDDPSWLMVRDAVSNLVLQQFPGGGRPNNVSAGSIDLARSCQPIFGPTVIPTSRNLACGAVGCSMPLSVSKTLLQVASAGFSDWITQRRTLFSTGQLFTALRCIHSVGVEVLQPPPIEMADDWFVTPPLGFYVGLDFVNLLRWAAPTIDSPVAGPLNIWTGTLPHCTA